MDDLTDSEVVDTIVEAIKELSIKIGIPQTLKEIGVKEEDLEILAKQAINDVCTAGNPRNVTEKDIVDLYKKAY